MTILLADDHMVVRRGLRDILADAFPGASFIEAGCAEEVFRALQTQPCSLLVLDVTMPGRSGVDVLREVKVSFPRLPVLILSVQPEDQYAMRCLAAGASGYLSKDSAEDQLVRAVRRVLIGKRYLSPQLSDKLVNELRHPSVKQPHELLSDRELEVARMIGEGRSLTDIAGVLQVSIKTVSTYRTRSLLKMQLRNNAELTRYMLEHKLIA